MKKIFSLLIAAVIFTLSACGASPAHVHISDNYGTCITCFGDICHPLFDSNSRLSSGEVFAKDGEKLYFRFKPNGEGQTVITVNCGSAVMAEDGVTLYTKSSLGLALTYLGTEGSTVKYRYDEPLDSNTTYYLSFTVASRGTVIVNADCHLTNS